MLLLLITVCVANVLFASGVLCVPLGDHGPHLDHGWGQVVRLRHLYAARPGLHLLIGVDGQVRGSAEQTMHSKWTQAADPVQDGTLRCPPPVLVVGLVLTVVV